MIAATHPMLAGCVRWCLANPFRSSGLNVDSGGLDEQSRLTTAITGDRQRGVCPFLMLAVFFR